MDDPAGFADFVSARSPDLLRSGWLLTGDWHSAHDLVQTALEKTWLRWGRLERRDRPEVYVRRVMVTTYLSWRRRRWNRESPYGEVPDVSADDSSSGVTDVRLALVAALRQLTPRQRAVLVLRYFDGLRRGVSRRRLRQRLIPLGAVTAVAASVVVGTLAVGDDRTGRGPDIVDTPTPTVTSTGTSSVKAFLVIAHCGIEFVEIDGQTWRTEPRDDGNGNPPTGWPDWIQGMLTIVDPTTAVFTSDEIPEPLVFHPAPDATPDVCY